MKRNVLLIAMVASLFTTGCFRHEIEGNGLLITETRSAGSFTHVSSEGDFEVYIANGQTCTVEVEAESNLQPYILAEVHSSELVVKVRDRRDIETNFPVKIFVTLPVLTGISLTGSGNIRCDSTRANDIHIALSGSGDIYLEAYTNQLKAAVSGSGDIFLDGETHETDFDISGSGSISSFGMEQDTCFADISGSGSMYLFVTDFLDVRISGSGTIYYKGTPVINTQITGSGSVVHQ